jgi:MFS family permease
MRSTGRLEHREIAMRTVPASPTGVAIAATTGNMVGITASIHATIGIFLVPIATDFDWPRASVSGVLGLVALVNAALYPFVGRAMDRFGSRRILIGGNVLLAASIALLSRSTGNVTQFYLLFGLIGVAGSLAGSAMYCKVVSNWFNARRGLMLGVTAGLGNGVGATVLPIVAGLLVSAYGWRNAYLGIAAMVFLIGFPILFLFLRDAPARIEADPAELEGMTLREAAHTRAFWLMLVAIAAGAGGMTAVFTHVVPMLTDHGVGRGEATGVVATFALVTAAWQIVTGGLLDKLNTPRLIVPMYAVAIAGLLLLEFGSGTTAIMAAGAMLGIGMGAEYGALGYFISRYFGLKHYGAIVGALYSVVILAQGITPGLMDMSFDSTGSYATATIAIAVALGFGTILLALLPPLEVQKVRAGELGMALAA